MSFARSLFTVSGLTVLSRVGGFIRDTLTAMFLGAGPLADAYFVAQRLPNLFRSLFAEGAFTAAFVPLYTAEELRGGQSAAQLFAAEALAMLSAILIPFSVLIIIFMPQALLVLAPGFQDDPAKFQAAVIYSRITFPYLMLVSITALQGGVLNAHGIFGPGAATPIALNVILIAALFLNKSFGLEAGNTLSWAMTLAGVVQMLWLMWSCHKAGISIPLILPRFTTRTARLFKQVGPGAIGAGATQINIMISTILASLLPTGAVSFLYYADRLNQLPLGIVGIAVATTLLPVLSRYVASGDEEKVRHYMGRAIEFCLMLGLPATIGLALVAQPIISTLFEHGEFTHADTVETAKALMAYSLGIPAFLLVKVFAASFYARQDTRTPVKIALVSMVINVLSALLLLGPFQHVGIAFATSLATWANVLMLYRKLRRSKHPLGDDKLRKRLPRLLISAGAMGLTTEIVMLTLNEKFLSGPLVFKSEGLIIIIGLSSLVYVLLLQATGAMRWRDALNTMKRPSSQKD
jgi:putative peptidoglycan lipid II flippase